MDEAKGQRQKRVKKAKKKKPKAEEERQNESKSKGGGGGEFQRDLANLMLVQCAILMCNNNNVHGPLLASLPPSNQQSAISKSDCHLRSYSGNSAQIEDEV